MIKLRFKEIDGQLYESCEQVPVPYFGKMMMFCGRPWGCPACNKIEDDRIHAWALEHPEEETAKLWLENNPRCK